MKHYYRRNGIKRIKRYIFSLFLCFLTLLSIFKNLNSSKIKINNKNLVDYLINKTTYKKNNYINKVSKKILRDIYNNPTKYLVQTNSHIIKKKNIVPTIKESIIYEPQIYIYNSHQTEEYAPSSFVEYSVKPTVTMASYIIEETLKKYEYQVFVETSSIKDILNKNNWKYSQSYQATRLLLEQRKNEYPTLKYFIDVHRDSLKKDRTTVTINDKAYAKLLFVVGLENENYEKNLAFTEEINSCLNAKYPNLSKGIYKKSGPGVNGIYNQDFSEYTILIEVGGYENTTNEVLNSSIAFSNCFMEVISTRENKTAN